MGLGNHWDSPHSQLFWNQHPQKCSLKLQRMLTWDSLCPLCLLFWALWCAVLWTIHIGMLCHCCPSLGACPTCSTLPDTTYLEVPVSQAKTILCAACKCTRCSNWSCSVSFLTTLILWQNIWRPMILTFMLTFTSYCRKMNRQHAPPQRHKSLLLSNTLFSHDLGEGCSNLPIPVFMTGETASFRFMQEMQTPLQMRLPLVSF